MEAAEKNRVSHRGKAVRAMVEKLKKAVDNQFRPIRENPF